MCYERRRNDVPHHLLILPGLSSIVCCLYEQGSLVDQFVCMCITVLCVCIYTAMLKKPVVTEVRTPTNTWSGLGFSKSMPAETIKELRRANHVSYKPSMTTTYEVRHTRIHCCYHSVYHHSAFPYTIVKMCCWTLDPMATLLSTI